MSEPRLEELLTRYREARRERPEVTAEEICRDCPELVATLKEQLQTQASKACDPFATVPPPADPFVTTDPFATQPTATTNEPVVIPGAPVIAGYDILQELGRGGMGVVYLAVQRATKRRVALKVLLHGGYASDQQRRRFEREVDLAASLRHPHIVTVYDSGTTGDGLPYCVMEHIAGCCLDEHVRNVNMSREARLRLFVAICEAVNVAHQHGVIHRDLKPANIRVDADGGPHILDFGLAKTVGPGMDEQGRSLTHTGEFLGTLAYAAPEQAAGDSHRIDVRTDVYALGVILYELLTDRNPHPINASLSELLKALVDQDPEPPSRHLPKGEIDEALDAIVMKALERSRTLRYQSAGELADDVSHYLAGEPIRAQPPSAAFLLRRWLRQNLRATMWVVLIGVVFGGLGALGVGISILPLLNLSAHVYNKFPSLQRPWLATEWTLPMEWIRALSMLGTLAFVCMGLFTALLVRPKRRLGDVLAGLATGIVGGVTAFVITLGWVSVISSTLTTSTGHDLHLLRVYSMDRSAVELMEAYPDLAALSAEERGDALTEKVVGDLVVGVARGLWLGVLFVLVGFSASSVLGTLLAGTLIRRHGRLGIAVLPYLEATLPCSWIIVEAYIALFLRHRRPHGSFGPLALFVGISGLAVLGVTRQWPWPIRGSAYTAVLLALVSGVSHTWNWAESGAAAVAIASLLGWSIACRKLPEHQDTSGSDAVALHQPTE
jgi:hypothetical protein